ncbi:hypothetical protein THASP1DRAFT_32246 [Thamnocephalis sphaerospora]|uniref:Signal recognition particle subunit SRP72 n=1 Tax=Thamnocephalis sphaerospora TaxID=78915 RepID=A0A4P9XJI1_9FUNG|nr:hypothetical protein THASP1DRAFT_32246 [Thamnocephalis sphaerospora]|eukprot:RKP05924.1 hypothetical protein THASP1DRAFT_32246 [Thamnocephalis sphaerospora]
MANLLAAKAAALTSGMAMSEQMLQVKPDQLHTYDQMYNAACVSIANEKLPAAEQLLRQARDNCRSTLREQDYTEDEIEAELSAILAQLAYVCQRQGKVEESLEYNKMILETKIAEGTVATVVANNYVAQCRSAAKQVHEQNRRLQLAADPRIEAKLFMSQRRVLAANRAIMQLRLKKASIMLYTVAREAAKRLSSHEPRWSVPYLISAAAPYCQGKRQRAVEELKRALEKQPSLSGVRLALVRLLIDAGQALPALELLDAGEQSDRPHQTDALSMAVRVYESAKRPEQAHAALDRALAHHQKAKDTKSANAVLRLRAAFRLRQGQAEGAAQDYAQLVQADPDDTEALAGLVTAYADYKSEQADQYASMLVSPPPMKRLNLDELEAHVPGLGRSSVPRQMAAAKKASKTPVQTAVSKRKRANPPAKNFDPAKQPDPERWLPKRERAGFKPKGRKRGGKAAASGGSQGVALVGGGLGGTGSARIEGRSAPIIAEHGDEDEAIKPAQTAAKAGGSKKKKGKGKGKGKW